MTFKFKEKYYTTSKSSTNISYKVHAKRSRKHCLTTQYNLSIVVTSETMAAKRK